MFDSILSSLQTSIFLHLFLEGTPDPSFTRGHLHLYQLTGLILFILIWLMFPSAVFPCAGFLLFVIRMFCYPHSIQCSSHLAGFADTLLQWPSMVIFLAPLVIMLLLFSTPSWLRCMPLHSTTWMGQIHP